VDVIFIRGDFENRDEIQDFADGKCVEKVTPKHPRGRGLLSVSG
jgi:hypothetical protein